MKPTTIYDLLNLKCIFFLQDIQIKTYDQKEKEEELIWEGSASDIPFYLIKSKLDTEGEEGYLEADKDKIIIWVVE